MSRIDSSGSTSLPIDTPEAGPTPAPSRKKDPHTPAPAARNEVRAYDGPPPRAARGAAPESAPAASGPAVSAGELAALGGRPRPASPSEVPGPVYEGLRSHLTRSLRDWAVTEGDVKAVHTALGALRPEAYRAALERLEREGLLGTYVKAQDTDTRRAFLEQAESKGLLQRRQGDLPAGPPGFPAEPDFFRNDASLPGAMRDAVNQHAIHAGAAYHEAHAAYLDRYIEAVNAAKSPQELWALGEPKAARLREKALGIAWKDPAREAYEAAWKRGIGPPRSLNRAYQAVRARELELAGERPGGSIQVHGRGELTRGGVKVGREAQVDTRGRVGLKEEAGLALKGGPVGLELMRDTEGRKKAEAKLALGPVELSIGSDGERKLGLGVGQHLQAFVALNPETAEFGGGVSAEVEREGHTLGAETGFSMKGLTARRARESFDPRHRGVFEPPRELAAGTAWDALPAEQRERYAKTGWTRDAWTRALAR